MGKLDGTLRRAWHGGKQQEFCEGSVGTGQVAAVPCREGSCVEAATVQARKIES